MEINLSRFPVLAVAISGKVDDRILFKIAKSLKNDIESISEVLEVKTLGERERLIEIIVNPTNCRKLWVDQSRCT